jgi:hypothetical protein
MIFATLQLKGFRKLGPSVVLTETGKKKKNVPRTIVGRKLRTRKYVCSNTCMLTAMTVFFVVVVVVHF